MKDMVVRDPRAMHLLLTQLSARISPVLHQIYAVVE